MGEKEDKQLYSKLFEVAASYKYINELIDKYLFGKGAFYVFIGITWVIYSTSSRQAGLEWIPVVSDNAVGALWIFSGLVPAIASFLDNVLLKRIGFFLLIVTPTLLGAYFLIAWIAYVIPSDPIGEGSSTGIITTASYWAYAMSAKIFSTIFTFITHQEPKKEV